MNMHFFCFNGPIVFEELKNLLRIFRERDLNSINKNHIIGLKFNIDYDTLSYGKSVDNPLYPNIDLLRILLKECKGKIFSIINYKTKSSYIYKEISYLLRDLGCQNYCDGIIINAPAPQKILIKKIRNEFRHLKLILELNESYKYSNLKELRDLINNDYDKIDYLLLKNPTSEKVHLDFRNLCKMFNVLNSNTNINFGFTGHFNPKNIVRNTEFIFNLINTKKLSINSDYSFFSNEQKYLKNDLILYIEKFINILNKI